MTPERKAPESTVAEAAEPASVERHYLTTNVSPGVPPPPALECIEVRTDPRPVPSAIPIPLARYDFRPSGAPEERELGRGGLGRVLVAVDRQLGREVAVKELLPEVARGSFQEEAAVRFVREARITGQLEHPNIVPVYEFGTGPGGTPYYTMRLVRGRTLAAALDSANDLPSRLALLHHFAGLCQAIAYAHSRGVIHRDIKPANVMIGEFGETVVLDWGIAKVRGAEEPIAVNAAHSRKLRVSDPNCTADGKVLGTPAFMSPEQAAGRLDDVDERSDVWALGAVLYRLLTGRVPFEATSLPGLLRKIRSSPVTAVRRSDASIPSDLAAIAERALQADKRARYADAAELLRDVLAYQSGARVDAYEYSSLELLRRFISKNRSAVGVAGLALVLLLGLGAMAYQRVVAARDRALGAEQRARESAESAEQNLAEAFADKARIALLNGELVGANLFAAKALALQERPDARGIVVGLSNRPLPVRSENLEIGADCSGVSYSFSLDVWRCSTPSKLKILSRSGQARTLEHTLSSEPSAVSASTVRPALFWGGADGHVGFWNHTDPASAVTWKSGFRSISAVALSSDAGFAAGADQNTIRIWAVDTGEIVASTTTGEPVAVLRFSEDQDQLAIGGRFGAQTLWRWRAPSSVLRMERHAGTILAVAFSEDGRYLATSGADRLIRFWNTTNGMPRGAPILVDSPALSLAWSADGRYVACGSEDHGVRLYDVRDQTSPIHLTGHESPVVDIQFSRDSRRLATSSRAGRTLTWTLEDGAPWRFSDRGNVLSLEWEPTGKEIVSAGLGAHGACLWTLDKGGCETRLPVATDRVRALAVSLDGSLLALAGSAGTVFVWDLKNRIPVRVIEAHRAEVRSLAFAPNGKQLCSASQDGSIKLWNVTAGTLDRTLVSTASVYTALYLDADTIVSGNGEGAIELWNVRDGRTFRRVRAHGDWVMEISVRGDTMATAGADGRVTLRRARTAELLKELGRHDGRALSVAVGPDARLVASSSEDRTVRLWSVEHGRELARLDGHEAAVRVVRFSPNGKHLASGSDDGTIRFWAMEALQASGNELLRRAEESTGLALSGTQLVPRPKGSRSFP